MKQLQPPTLSKVRLWSFRASVEDRTKLAATIYTAIMGIGIVIALVILAPKSKGAKDLVLGLLISLATILLIYVLFYYVMKIAIKSAEQKRDEAVGRRPTAKELKDMYVWYKYGVLPSSKKIRPILPSYLDYLESRLNGTYSDSFTGSKKFRYYFTLLAVIEIVTGIAQLFTHKRDVVGALIKFVVAVIWIGLFIRKPTTQPRRLVAWLNRKRLRKIADMRTQLAAIGDPLL